MNVRLKGNGVTPADLAAPPAFADSGDGREPGPAAILTYDRGTEDD